MKIVSILALVLFVSTQSFANEAPKTAEPAAPVAAATETAAPVKAETPKKEGKKGKKAKKHGKKHV